MSRKLICPNCEKKRLVEPINEQRLIEFKGEEYPVDVTLWRCLDCKEEFEDPNTPVDELDLAYRAYRKRHGLLQPEEIREIRQNLSLTQVELANLLGISPATLSRYENGGVQEKSHDSILQTLKDPVNVLELLERKQDALPEARAKALQQAALSKVFSNPGSYLIKSLELREPDINSGFVTFSFDRYIATIYRILSKCPNNNNRVPKTKLNKLLFYADFVSFKYNQRSITGSHYAHLPYGPCPDDFQELLGIMETRQYIVLEEEYFPNNIVAENVSSANCSYFDDILSDEDKEIIDNVCETLSAKTAVELSELSHAEKGYQLTGTGEIISYEYAQYLNFDS